MRNLRKYSFFKISLVEAVIVLPNFIDYIAVCLVPLYKHLKIITIKTETEVGREREKEREY